VLIGGVQENHVIDNASKSASSSTFTKKSSSSTDYVASSTLVGSSVNAGAISVKAGNDVIVTGSALTAQDALAVIAGRDLVVASGQQTVNESHSAETKKSGFSVKPAGFGYSKAEQQQNGASSTTTQLGSTISGGTVTAVAGRDLSVIASNVVADGAVVLAGTRDVNIVSAQNTTDSTSASSSKKSGSIGSSWQPAIGTVKTTEQGTSQSVTQAGSQVASLGGNVTIEAGERYTQTASNVIAPGGNIAIIAKDVQITAGYDTASSDSQSTFSKTAVGMTVSVPIVSTVQGIASLASAAKQAGSDRMTALAAVTAGMQVKDAYNNVTAAGDPAGIKIGVSLGTSKSESSTTQSSSTAVGSQVKAGGDVTIVATGGGAGSNITSIGSDISGGGNVTLVADNKINILAAENTSSQHSSNSSSGASIGVTYSMGGAQNGFSLELAANRANGKADGESTTYANSHVSAGNTVNLQSGGDTNIKGGVISASSVVANIGGDLNVQSLQDKVVYDSKQKSASVGISVCLPPACYGASSVSGSLSKAAVNGDFLSVVEQSGIKTGDGGFQLVVHGNTDLIGGVISSSQAAIDQGKNSLATGSLTYTALQNKDVYSADSFAMSGSVSGKFGDQGKAVSSADKLAAGGKAAPSATGGFGQDSGNQSSTTASAISAGVLTITDAAKQAVTGKTVEQALAGIATGVTTDTAAAQAGALTQAWNGEALMKEVQAQTQITQAFSAQAPRAIAQYASRQEELIRDQLKTDPTNPALLSDLSKWEEGGSYRTALHTLSGAATGGIGGALGAMAVAGAADPLNLIQEKMEGLLQQQGMSSEAAKMAAEALAQGTALGIGAITGGAAGAATALTADTNNRQSTLAEKKWLKQLQKDRSEERQKRFADAACALTRCSADLSDENPAKAGLLLQEQRGQSYISEQRDLVSTGLFRYGIADAIEDIGSRTSSRAKLELAHVANGAFNLGYLLATNGPGGNVQMPPDLWSDTGGWNGPSATAVVTPAVPLCSPFGCVIVPPVMMPGVPGYRPNNVLLSSNQNDSADKVHDAVSPGDSITNGQKGLSSAVTPGVNGTNSVPKSVELSFDKGTRTWTTPAGVDYGPGSVHGNRVNHVLDHAAPNPAKTTHSVFNVERGQVLGLVDEAWIAKGNPLPNDLGAYIVPMGRAIGTAGETNIKIIIRPGTNKIITAYPFQ
jgi:filamentous hemagglutinin